MNITHKKNGSNRSTCAVRFFAQNPLVIGSANEDMTEDRVKEILEATRKNKDSLNKSSSPRDEEKTQKTQKEGEEGDKPKNNGQSNCCLLI